MKETIKLSSLGKKNKALLISEETIQFSGKTIRREEITELKYGLSALVFYRFLVGRKHHIGFKTPTEQVNIIFKSYFGIAEEYFTDLCNQIIDEVWERATDKIWNKNKNLLIAGGVMLVGNCQVSKNGVFINQKQKLISWEDLHYEIKYDRLVLNHKSNDNVWTNLYFKDTWNIDILIALLDWITKENGLAEVQKK